MKKTNILLSLLLTLAATMTFTSCDDIQEDGFTVIKPGELNLTASLTQKEYDYEESQGVVNIKSNTKWKATTDETWISLSQTEGSGNAELAFTLSANTGAVTARTGEITITSVAEGVASQTVSLTQKFTTLSASAYSLKFDRNGGSQTLRITSSDTWNVFSEVDYLTITPESGSGTNTSVEITCQPNNSIATRSTTLVFRTTAANGEENQIEVTVIQDAASFGLSAVTRSLNAINGSSSFNIISDLAWSISIESEAGWCHLSSTSGTGNATIEITADDNDLAEQRTATLTVTTSGNDDTRSIVVTQAAAPIDMQTTVVEVIYKDYTSVIVGFEAVPGTTIVRKGVVYSLASQPSLPTLDNANQENEVTDDRNNRFRARITSLAPSTSYVVRGFITIEYDGVFKTYYGPMTEFTTKADPTQGDNPNPVNP